MWFNTRSGQNSCTLFFKRSALNSKSLPWRVICPQRSRWACSFKSLVVLTICITTLKGYGKELKQFLSPLNNAMVTHTREVNFFLRFKLLSAENEVLDWLTPVYAGSYTYIFSYCNAKNRLSSTLMASNSSICIAVESVG